MKNITIYISTFAKQNKKLACPIINVTFFYFYVTFQVLPIWEGTTNVLSLDVCRVLAKEGVQVFEALETDMKTLMSTSLKESSHPLNQSAGHLMRVLDELRRYAHPDILPLAARDFAFTLAKMYSGWKLGYPARVVNNNWKIVTKLTWLLLYSISGVIF